MFARFIFLTVLVTVFCISGSDEQEATSKDSIFSSLTIEECIEDLRDTARERNRLLLENVRLKRLMEELRSQLAEHLEIVERYKEAIVLLNKMYQ